MIWLSNSTLARLRDQLRTRGQRPSISLAGGEGLSPQAMELLGITAEYGPLTEAMYLMMSADGMISSEERDVLKGALRNLSGDAVRGVHIESLLDTASKNVAAEGREKRFQEITSTLRDDPARAEVAFVLAAAVAFADNAVADEENEILNSFAEGLGIDDLRANQLLDEIERELAAEADSER